MLKKIIARLARMAAASGSVVRAGRPPDPVRLRGGKSAFVARLVGLGIFLAAAISAQAHTVTEELSGGNSCTVTVAGEPHSVVDGKICLAFGVKYTITVKAIPAAGWKVTKPSGGSVTFEVTPGTVGTLSLPKGTVEFQELDGKENTVFSIPKAVVGCNVDLDVDSMNHWGNDYFTTNFRTREADAVEADGTKAHSKVIFVNNIDKDGDGVPDFMDGWSCPLTQVPALEREIAGKREVNPAERFVPMILELGIPKELADTVRIKFVYAASRPSTMKIKETPYSWNTQTKNKHGVGGFTTLATATIKEVVSEEGKIRIWMKDGAQPRNVDKDYVENSKVYTLSELGMALGSPKTFYIEGVNASSHWGDITITAMVSLDGGQTWRDGCNEMDAVRLTSIKSNYTVEVVTQYYRTWYKGLRLRFTPDYTSAATRMKNLWDIEKSDATHDRIHANEWSWHGGDDTVGHGFASFQYEGPDLGNNLSSECNKSNYWHKYFFGKTGTDGFTFWDCGSRCARNDQFELEWWDACEYKLDDGNRLVLRKTYTLPYDKLSALFATFNDDSRYKNFGLNINLDTSVKCWGCLSNVGLAMKDHGLDDANMGKCRITLTMPTTANKSVWRVIMGAYCRFGPMSGKFRAVYEAVRRHSENVAWGGKVANTGPDSLGADLFDILDGEKIYDEHTYNIKGAEPVWLIRNEASLGLNMGNDILDYYDPGLFPGVYGENPSDMFDMTK